MRIAVVIPFRDRGLDAYRKQNLDRVLAQWDEYGIDAHVVSDGRSGDEQFNRSAAYNLGRDVASDSDVIVYSESDMILPISQVMRGIELALTSPGLVVPFTTYKYLSDKDSQDVRLGEKRVELCSPESEMKNGASIGAVNIVSRQSLDLIGQWDENFEGNWYDDNAMERAFQVCCQARTRYVNGPAYHLYHLPGWSGDHLTEADRQATARNKARYTRYLAAKTPQEIRSLTKER